jgi:hypothetical protein
MSNLGTVYEISLSGGYKNIYPVVYKNKTKLFCKIYGCDDLEVVYTEDCPYNYNKKIVSLEQFKKIALENDKWHGWVYIPPHINYWFPELRESLFDRRINDYKNRIENIKRHIKTCEGTIKSKEEEIKDSKLKINQTEKEIIRLEKLRLEYIEEQKKHDET